MDKKLYVLSIIALRTSDFAEAGCEKVVKSSVVSLKEDTGEYKKAVMEKIAAKYVGAHAEDEEFEQDFSYNEQRKSFQLVSEWDYGYQGYELYGYRVELVPIGVIIEL